MKKFNYSTNPVESKGENKKQEVMKILNEKISFPEFTIYEKIIFSGWYFAFMCFSFALFFIPGFLLMIYRKKIWRKRALKNTGELMPVELYKTVFESQYSNVKVSRGEFIDYRILYKNRGIKIPRDANIFSSHVGPKFTIDKLTFKTMWVKWQWIRSDGKNSKAYYYSKIYLFVDDLKSSFKNFELEMKESRLFSNQGKDLENEKFNKYFWYKYNDPVKARIFFPPSSQERWVNVRNNQRERYNSLFGMQLYIRDGYYIFGRKDQYRSEYGSITTSKFSKTKDKFVENIYQNFQNDVVEISAALRLAIINKYFFK